MFSTNPHTLKLAQISSLFYQQNIPLILTLYSFDGCYKLVPHVKTEEHYLITHAANKFWNLINI